MSNKYDERWVRMSQSQKERVAHKHYNGNCICYGPRGAIVAGSRETGKDCFVCKLSGPYWEQARKIMSRA